MKTAHLPADVIDELSSKCKWAERELEAALRQAGGAASNAGAATWPEWLGPRNAIHGETFNLSDEAIRLHATANLVRLADTVLHPFGHDFPSSSPLTHLFETGIAAIASHLKLIDLSALGWHRNPDGSWGKDTRTGLAESPGTVLPSYEEQAKLAAAVQVNQYRSSGIDSGNPEEQRYPNTNCGPASLSMVLAMLGKTVPGSTPGQKVGTVREMIVQPTLTADQASAAWDKRSKAEKIKVSAGVGNDTGSIDLIPVAEKFGVSVTTIPQDSDAKSITDILKGGSKVIVNGKYTEKGVGTQMKKPWITDNSTGVGLTHIVALTGYDERTHMYLLNDPLRNTPLSITEQQLSDFISGATDKFMVLGPK